jgi:hypothetical protein
MEAIILPNELFDDGSIECKTFCVCTSDDSIVCELSYIKLYHFEYMQAIQDAIKDGKYYIVTSFGEIQWD